jgi:predicted amidophosphoribosyltransferase
LRVVTEVREVHSTCPGCNGKVAPDFVACPACGRRLSGACPGCGRGLQPGWTFCPYCARGTEPRTERRLRERKMARAELPAASTASLANMADFKKGMT